MPKSKNRRKPKSGTASSPKRPETAKMSAEGAAATIEGASAEPRAKSKGSVGPVQFFRQVRDEMRKVTWTSRNETFVSTIMVLIMVAIASLFFFAVDSILRWIVPMILSFSF